MDLPIKRDILAQTNYWELKVEKSFYNANISIIPFLTQNIILLLSGEEQF